MALAATSGLTEGTSASGAVTRAAAVLEGEPSLRPRPTRQTTPFD